ncbi:MAG: DUF3575 domain-containing protein, partial [Bacteroides sp.]|nr:DUF3575 domain-containing protein [Bacteroides sp.]
MSVKSNMLYDAMTTLNAGVEFSLASRWTLDLEAALNPWKYSEEAQLKHWFIQPELRYWPCRKFEGHFVGAHFLYGDYDVEGTSFFKDRKYDGTMVGGEGSPTDINGLFL